MKHYKHQQASSAKEAASSAASGTAALIAGGTDLLGTLKDEILPTYPDTVIDLKTIPDMDAIVERRRRGAYRRAGEAVRRGRQRRGEERLRGARRGVRAGRIAHQSATWADHRRKRVPACIAAGTSARPTIASTASARAATGARRAWATTATIPSSAIRTAAMPPARTTRAGARGAGSHRGHHEAGGSRRGVLQGQRRALERAGGRRGGHRVQGAEGRQERVSEVRAAQIHRLPLGELRGAQGGDGEVRVVLGGVYPAPMRSSEAEAEVAGGVNDAAASKAVTPRLLRASRWARTPTKWRSRARW